MRSDLVSDRPGTQKTAKHLCSKRYINLKILSLNQARPEGAYHSVVETSVPKYFH